MQYSFDKKKAILKNIYFEIHDQYLDFDEKMFEESIKIIPIEMFQEIK